MPYGNEFEKIPDTTTVVFKPKKIRHFILSLGFDGSSLKFSIKEVQNTEDPKNVESYAKGIAKNPSVLSVKQLVNTPYDVDIDDQCYVLFELNSSINWHFTRNEYGITAKKNTYRDDNFGAHHVYKSGAHNTNVVESDSCSVLYLGIAKRLKDEAQSFNINVTFNQEDNVGGHNIVKNLVVIMDPDIKNSGNEFPPPDQPAPRSIS